ncbi:uncharacterized protein C8A04DRAFT_15301 [Dichotomopilus funicola]|uniref:Uncharacterized protein n=1 Tax=Dichotomopilus funicola TaxID=1934379 RepID=A0AAN6UW55_9PEZI|nr:hypothetical protein C8A04DRAFT_15301 [Dichotomopilus funicola]
MCHKTTCNTCQKTTWFGCGFHVPSVMDSVPKDEWCTCEPKVEKSGREYPPAGSVLGGLGKCIVS